MAKQTIRHGQQIDTITPEEMAEIFKRPYERVVLGLGGAESIEDVVDDVPAKGIRTILTSMRRGGGSDNFIVPANTFVKLCDFRTGRVGGTVQNIGSNPCYLYLAPLTRVQRLAQQGAINSIIVGYIATNGSFDFKLTNDCWCGPITAWSLAGTTLVWGEH